MIFHPPQDSLDSATTALTNVLSDPKALGELESAAGKSVPRPRKSRRFRRPTAMQRESAARKPGEKGPMPLAFRVPPSAGPGACAPITLPFVGEWLDEHEERGQTVSSFTRMCMRVIPHTHVRVIEIVPLGKFGRGKQQGCDIGIDLDALQRYMEAFFCLPCRLAKPMSLKTVSAQSREGSEGQLQVEASEVFDALLRRKKDRDVLCSVAITMADLYCHKDGVAWNFIFGQARLMDGVGVYSFARYAPGGYPIAWQGSFEETIKAFDISKKDVGSAPSIKQPIHTKSDMLLMQRCAKVMTHETGHIFGIKHCIYYNCLMNGANHLEEFDKKPLHLCPVCLRKLHISIGFQNIPRYNQLNNFYAGMGWVKCAEWAAAKLSVLETS